MSRALRARDEIQTTYPNANISLIAKPGGYFDVIVDGKTIFSKTAKIGTFTERFPDAGEIVLLCQKAGYTQ